MHSLVVINQIVKGKNGKGKCRFNMINKNLLEYDKKLKEADIINIGCITLDYEYYWYFTHCQLLILDVIVFISICHHLLAEMFQDLSN